MDLDKFTYASQPVIPNCVKEFVFCTSFFVWSIVVAFTHVSISPIFRSCGNCSQSAEIHPRLPHYIIEDDWLLNVPAQTGNFPSAKVTYVLLVNAFHSPVVSQQQQHQQQNFVLCLVCAKSVELRAKFEDMSPVVYVLICSDITLRELLTSCCVRFHTVHRFEIHHVEQRKVLPECGIKLCSEIAFVLGKFNKQLRHCLYRVMCPKFPTTRGWFSLFVS